MKKITITAIFATILAVGCSKQQNIPETNNKPVMVRLGTVNLNSDTVYYKINIVK